jgi:uncharacterized membrane protein required for colicin V production
MVIFDLIVIGLIVWTVFVSVFKGVFKKGRKPRIA